MRILVPSLMMACSAAVLSSHALGGGTKGERRECNAYIITIKLRDVTFREVKGKESSKAETLPVAGNVRVVWARFDKDTKKMEAGEAVEGGLRNEIFQKASEKGQPSRLIIQDGMIIEIRVIVPKKLK